MNEQLATVLVVDDDVHDRESYAEGLHAQGFECLTARNAPEALSRLADERRVDVLIADYRLPDTDGLELARTVKKGWRHVDIIIVTAYATVEAAHSGGLLGVAQFLQKPVTATALGDAVRKLVRNRRRPRSVSVEAAMRVADQFGGLIGVHPTIEELRARIDRIAEVEANVLIRGEPGVGKERVARAIHQRGKRSDREFCVISCAAPSDELSMALFGSTSRSPSRLRGSLARAGSIFLDDVVSLSAAFQTKLFVWLEQLPSESYAPRLFSSTSVDLAEAVREGRFREDLHHRLAVLDCSVPTLRRRVTDLPFLAAAIQKDEIGQVLPLAPDADFRLQNHSWPGNVRELRRVILSAAVEASDEIRLEHLPKPFCGDDEGRESFPTYDEVTRDHVVRALAQSRWNRTAAAELLKIPRNRLARMIKRYDIRQEETVDML